METWRVIYDGKQTASYNMAADAYLLEAAEEGRAEPVLRLYGWDRPSITIGYHQKYEKAVDTSQLGTTPVVRRITGGRALLHDDGELTYALAGHVGRFPVLGQSLHETYNLISRAIVRFYQSLGWPAAISHRDQPVSLAPSATLQKGCFASVSQYEIIVGGQKVAAGSQRRGQSSFMQHGAIKTAAPSRHPAIVEPPQLVGSVDLVAPAMSREELAGNLTKAFEEILMVKFQKRPFDDLETAAINGFSADFKNLNRA